jgi:nucleoside-diphosphate-sugar epimerase
MRTVVTGCAGFIGSHVAERLAAGGWWPRIAVHDGLRSDLSWVRDRSAVPSAASVDELTTTSGVRA